MADSITNHISKGVTQITDPSKKALWFQTNFNMPIHDFVSGGAFTRFDGPVTYDGEATSFDLTGFSPGFEICNGAAVYDFDNTGGGGSRSISTTVVLKWTDTSNVPLNGAVYTAVVSTSIPAGSWFDYWLGANIGFESSEIATSTTYDFRSSTSGTPTIPEVVTAISFTNVPTITTLSSNDMGYMWVEGNNLAYVNASQWKHSMAGVAIGATGKTPGYIWVDDGLSTGTPNALHWVGNDGKDYTNAWQVQQFASFYSNSSTSAVFAGTTRAGYIWVDDQFGQTHLGYIGYDGFKYLTGAGVNPY